MAGRCTPLMRPIRNSALAIVAPVLPALTIADAAPSRTASAARTSEESFMRRTLAPGSASMAMTSEASITGRSPASNSSDRPTSTTGTPSSATACLAPATISPGAKSPPIASTAMGSMVTSRATGSVDGDGLTAVVPAAVAAHHVRALHGATTRAAAAGRGGDAPGRRTTAAALGLGGLLLGDGHGRSWSRASGTWCLGDGEP